MKLIITDIENFNIPVDGPAIYFFNTSILISKREICSFTSKKSRKKAAIENILVS